MLLKDSPKYALQLQYRTSAPALQMEQKPKITEKCKKLALGSLSISNFIAMIDCMRRYLILALKIFFQLLIFMIWNICIFLKSYLRSFGPMPQNQTADNCWSSLLTICKCFLKITYWRVRDTESELSSACSLSRRPAAKAGSWEHSSASHMAARSPIAGAVSLDLHQQEAGGREGPR